MAKKFYLIGIDAAPLWIIKALYKKYSMNGFANFIENGFLGDMESTLPPLTGTAWPSIYTGLTPSEHGSMDFFIIDKSYTKQLVYYNTKQSEPVWETLAKNKLNSLVITPPMVLQSANADSRVDLITGFPLPPRFSSKYLEDAAKKFKMKGESGKIEEDMKAEKISTSEAAKEYNNSINERSKLAKYLISKKDYQFVFVCFTEVDRLQHFSLNKKDWEEPLATLYKSISNFIEWIIEESKNSEDEVMIGLVSDHGAQPIDNKFLLNAWLINNKYATLKKSVMDSIIQNEAKSGDSKSLKYEMRENLMKSKIRTVYDKMPAAAKRTASKTVGKLLGGASGGVYTRLHDFDFDMSKTKAFSSISNNPVGMIFINDKRFSTPTVSETEKQKIKKEIILELEKLKSEDGKKLIAEVFDGDKYYGKTKLFITPDIMLQLRERYTNDVFNYSRQTIFQKPELAKSGDHIREAIFGLTTNYKLNLSYLNKKHVDVYSVQPTILKYFGIKCYEKNSLI